MSLKIDQDHSRFRAIVRGKIRQNLRKYISQGELIGRKGKDLVSIPIPQIDIPRFRFGDKQRAGRARATASRATRWAAIRDGEERRARRPGRRRASTPSRWTSPSTSSRRSSARSSSSRTSSDKGKSKIINAKDRYTSIRRVGPESLRNFKRTYREALKRQISMGTYAPGNPVVVPIPDDKRYRSWKTRGRARRQRGHHLHDGRVGLDGRRAEGDRAHRELLDRCVAAEAVQGPREPLHHPRRRGARGRPGHVLPHARERRHDDLRAPTSSARSSSTTTTRPRSGTSTRSTSPTATTGRWTTRSSASSS